MCLKGGPRCHTHAHQALEKITAKYNSAIESSVALKNRRDDIRQAVVVPYNARKITVLDKKIAEAELRVEALSEKVKTASEERNATPEGLDRLERKYEELSKSNPLLAEKVKSDYDTAKVAYEAMILRHDRENKTVDTKIPSGYASRLGLEYLKNQKERNRKATEKAKKAKKRQSVERLKNQARLLDEQEKHALKTLERIKSGDLDRMDAPPSAVLKKSAEYRSYMQSAIHAEQAETTSREYQAIGLRPDGSARVHPQSSHYKAWAAREKKAYDARMNPTREFKLPEIPAADTSKYTRIEQFPLAERKKRLAAGWVDQVDGQEKLF